MLRSIQIFLIILLCGCVTRKPPLDTGDFLSEGLNQPKKIGTIEIESRYWSYKNFLVHFISNANAKNQNLSPIIYVHGLGGSLDGFLDLIKLIHPSKSSRPYYAIDLPPFGRSALRKSELTIHDYTEMLQDFVALLPTITKINLVCHSMGGQVCIDFALAHPEKIQLLTLISPAGVYEKTPFVDGAVNHFAGINVGSVAHPHAVSIGDMTWYDQGFNRRMITNNPLMLIAVESFRLNFHERIKDLKTKTLILWGHDDAIFNFENGLYLKENIENSTLYVIDGANHTPMSTHAALISQLIQKYL